MSTENIAKSEESKSEKKSTTKTTAVKKSAKPKSEKKPKPPIQKTVAVNEVKAVAKYVRISPIKLQRVADVVRGKSADTAMSILKRLPHRGARVLYDVVKSAVSNATHNHDLKDHPLKVTTLAINEGPRLKRFQPKARGRIYEILKRTSHITVGLKSQKGE